MQVYPTTLSELVCGVARYDGAKPALIFADQPISYADLDMRIECAANSLALRGVVHGDRVALLIPNMPEFVVAYYAVLRCGGIAVPVNALYKAEEIAYILQDSEAKALSLYAGFAAQGNDGSYYLMTSGHCDKHDGSAWTYGDGVVCGLAAAAMHGTRWIAEDAPVSSGPNLHTWGIGTAVSHTCA